MSVYHFAEGAFDLPAGWVDQSVHMLVRGSSDATPAIGPTLVLNRQPLTLPFTEQVAANVMTMRRSLPGFKEIAQKDGVVGELPTMSIEFSWRKDSTTVTQKVVFVAHLNSMLTITLSGGLGSWAEAQRELDGIVASLRFRTPESVA